MMIKMLEMKLQIFLVTYAAVGIVISLILNVAITKDYAKEFGRKIRQARDAQCKIRLLQNWRWMLSMIKSDEFIILVLATSILVPSVIALWPIVLLSRLKNKNKLLPSASFVLPELKKFVVEREHFQLQLSVKEIEDQEMIFDPRGAVPNLPFGHLNAVWVKFKAEIPLGGEIWTFSAPWDGRWRTGYVILCGENIGTHWVLACKTVEEGT